MALQRGSHFPYELSLGSPLPHGSPIPAPFGVMGGQVEHLPKLTLQSASSGALVASNAAFWRQTTRKGPCSSKLRLSASILCSPVAQVPSRRAGMICQ